MKSLVIATALILLSSCKTGGIVDLGTPTVLALPITKLADTDQCKSVKYKIFVEIPTGPVEQHWQLVAADGSYLEVTEQEFSKPVNPADPPKCGNWQIGRLAD